MTYIIKQIDNFLDSKTMYSLVLRSLLILAVFAILFGFLGVISHGGVPQILSLLTLLIVCYCTNYSFAKIVSAPRNLESVFITALILFFIIAPATDMHGYGILSLAGTLAMASKYILVIRSRHIFNPAGISIFILGLSGFSSVIWWVGTSSLLPIVAILGLLILRKINRFRLFISFFVVAIITILGFALRGNANLYDTVIQVFTSWPIIFFGTIMLTEPLTSPSKSKQQTIYGMLVGFLFGVQFHIGPLFSTPEFALIVGNIYSHIVNPKHLLKLVLHQKNKLAHNVYEFVFSGAKKLENIPGQYMEWTLPHKNTDGRGTRRYFTIASSPTENDIKIGVRTNIEKGSSFKKSLVAMKEGESIVASELSGDFILPKDKNKKLVFMAGGIGITPFRSMVQYLIHKNEPRAITLFYSNKTVDDVVYKEIFDKAEKIGIKTIYALTDASANLSNLPNSINKIDRETIIKHIPDYKERIFYLSGPRGMVTSFEELLQSMGVKRNQIKIDFFPGFA